MPLARPLDLRSTLIGLGLAGSLFCLTALAPTPAPALKMFRLTFDPDPTSIVRVDEGEPFTVPAKLLLVIKAAAGPEFGDSTVKINGEIVLRVATLQAPQDLAFPLVAKAGDIVSIEPSFPDPQQPAFVTGYLSE